MSKKRSHEEGETNTRGEREKGKTRRKAARENSETENTGECACVG